MKNQKVSFIQKLFSAEGCEAFRAFFSTNVWGNQEGIEFRHEPGGSGSVTESVMNRQNGIKIV